MKRFDIQNVLASLVIRLEYQFTTARTVTLDQRDGGDETRLDGGDRVLHVLELPGEQVQGRHHALHLPGVARQHQQHRQHRHQPHPQAEQRNTE